MQQGKDYWRVQTLRRQVHFLNERSALRQVQQVHRRVHRPICICRLPRPQAIDGLLSPPYRHQARRSCVTDAVSTGQPSLSRITLLPGCGNSRGIRKDSEERGAR
jgi:hypothetical protein